MEEVQKRLSGKQPLDPLRRVFNELNQPSVDRFKKALRSRNIPFTNQQVNDIVSRSPAKQIFAPRPRCEARITSSGLTVRWAADVANFTATPSGTGQKYILCVQDIYSRKLYTVDLAKHNPSAMATAFRIILAEAGATPSQLNTDQGAEFTSGAFPVLLDDQGISHNVKDPRDRQAISTLDRAIQCLKTNVMKGGSLDTWSSRLAVVTRGMNASPQGHLLGSAPNDVPNNDQL